MRVAGKFRAPAALSPVKRPGTHCVRGGWARVALEGHKKSRLYRDPFPGLSRR